MNRPRFEAELAAAGVKLLGLSDDGRACLLDGTVVTAEGKVEGPDLTGAAAYLAILAGHDGRPSAPAGSRSAMTALALVVTKGALAPAWAHDTVKLLAGR